MTSALQDSRKSLPQPGSPEAPHSGAFSIRAVSCAVKRFRPRMRAQSSIPAPRGHGLS